MRPLVILSEGAPIYPSFVYPACSATPPWRHVAAVASTNGVRLYLNGSLGETKAYTEGLFTNGPDQQAFLGLHCLSWIASLHGEMDEVRLWRTARTPEQIRENMGRKLTGSEEGLVGLWNFDDPANPGRDASPGAHHGKLIGQATVTNAALPVIVSGNITDACRQTAGERERRNPPIRPAGPARPGQRRRRVCVHDFCPPRAATCLSRTESVPPIGSAFRLPVNRNSDSTGC